MDPRDLVPERIGGHYLNRDAYRLRTPEEMAPSPEYLTAIEQAIASGAAKVGQGPDGAMRLEFSTKEGIPPELIAMSHDGFASMSFGDEHGRPGAGTARGIAWLPAIGLAGGKSPHRKGRTWLDQMVLDVYDAARAADMKIAKEGPIATFERYKWDAALTGAEMFGGYGTMSEFIRAMGDTEEALLLFNMGLVGSILTWLLADEDMIAARAKDTGLNYQHHFIDVDPDVAHDLFGHEAPDVDFWGGAFPFGTMTYMDFGRAGITLKEGHTLRAIVASYHYGADGKPELDFNIILEPDWDQRAYLHALIYGDLRTSRNLHGAFFTKEAADGARKAVDAAEDLFKMAWLLYLERKDTLPLVKPQLTAKAIKATKRADKQLNKLRYDDVSLFSVVNLRSRERLIPAEARVGGEGGDRQLGVRHPVRGHFRWQPYGEGSRKDPSKRQHRLTWIDAFERGPKGAPKKRAIVRLEGEDA